MVAEGEAFIKVSENKIIASLYLPLKAFDISVHLSSLLEYKRLESKQYHINFCSQCLPVCLAQMSSKPKFII